MARSLSVLLPVHNAESQLAEQVREILEIIPELTARFEVLIVDDGSTDATIEVATEMAAQFPQVNVVRNGCRQGRAAAISAGLQQTSGDVVFIEDEDSRLPLDEVHRLWKAVGEHEMVVGRPRHGDIERWKRWLPESPMEPAGYQMGIRRAITSLGESLARQSALLEEMARRGHPWHEIEVRPRTAAGDTTTASRPTAEPDPTPAAPPAITSRPKRPNYLTIADFAPSSQDLL